MWRFEHTDEKDGDEQPRASHTEQLKDAEQHVSTEDQHEQFEANERDAHVVDEIVFVGLIDRSTDVRRGDNTQSMTKMFVQSSCSRKVSLRFRFGDRILSKEKMFHPFEWIGDLRIRRRVRVRVDLLLRL